MPTLESLSEDIFLLVCLQLAVPDVISLCQIPRRSQVCRRFGEATQTKLLWVHFLDVATSEEDVILPAYLKTRELLSAAELKALVTRVTRLAYRWRSQELCPVKVWRLYLLQSITWLRLVSGSWLFVASSDNHVSKISCWDLSLFFQGYPEPIAKAYLPEQVRTARLEVQDSGIVLAFGLVLVVTLRQYQGSHYFMELCRVEGSSQVLMLHDNFLGCALRNDVIVPHMIDWRTNEIYELPPPLGPFDVLDRRSVPHLFVIWNDLIVIVRQESLELYGQPSPAAGPTYLKSLNTVKIWEVVVLDRLALLKLLVISSSGVELLTLGPDAVFDADAICAHFPLAVAPGYDDTKPWYHLSADGTGQRALWLHAAGHTHPTIVSMDISHDSQHNLTSLDSIPHVYQMALDEMRRMEELWLDRDKHPTKCNLLKKSVNPLIISAAHSSRNAVSCAEKKIAVSSNTAATLLSDAEDSHSDHGNDASNGFEFSQIIADLDKPADLEYYGNPWPDSERGNRSDPPPMEPLVDDDVDAQIEHFAAPGIEYGDKSAGTVSLLIV
ncbi:hypothetical protein DFH09DRAFT_1448695 [Mycena vulgaris]|nr:hypothetical protein DFH09DRAFT_1448695 [Mycena vulgaris]